VFQSVKNKGVPAQRFDLQQPVISVIRRGQKAGCRQALIEVDPCAPSAPWKRPFSCQKRANSLKAEKLLSEAEEATSFTQGEGRGYVLRGQSKQWPWKEILKATQNAGPIFAKREERT